MRGRASCVRAAGVKSTALAVIHCQTKMGLLENESVKRNATNYNVLQFLSLKCNGPRTQRGVEVLLEKPLSSRSVTVFNMFVIQD